MISNMMIILGIIYIAFALFYLIYSWLEIRQEERKYKELKDRLDEEMERILKELDEESERLHEEEEKK